VLVIALRAQTPKHIKGGWSHYTDTSEPVDGDWAQNMVTVQSKTFRSLAHEPQTALKHNSLKTGETMHNYYQNVTNFITA
jgi:hypothetical protein